VKVAEKLYKKILVMHLTPVDVRPGKPGKHFTGITGMKGINHYPRIGI
jgi:hypothetical protein